MTRACFLPVEHESRHAWNMWRPSGTQTQEPLVKAGLGQASRTCWVKPASLRADAGVSSGPAAVGSAGPATVVSAGPADAGVSSGPATMVFAQGRLRANTKNRSQ